MEFKVKLTEETKKYLKEKGYVVDGQKNLEELIEEERKKIEKLPEVLSKKVENKMTTNISWLNSINEAKYYYGELKELAKELHDVIREVYEYKDVREIIEQIDNMLKNKPYGILFEMYIGALLIMRAIKIIYPKIDDSVHFSESDKIKEIKRDLEYAIEKGDFELVEYIIEELKTIVGDFREKRANQVKELLTTIIKAKQKKFNDF